uniref:Glycosyltransferase family 92 protein n=1 Tax=Cacopsylla melanoneura TaxID=428564 RepID=A0A8D8YWY8_9HEMI
MASRHMRDLLSKREKRTRERKNLSFIIVIMFFVIFCVIVLTEILVMEDRNKNKPMSFFSSHSRRSGPEYEDRQVVYEDAELYKDIVDASRFQTSSKSSSASKSQSVLPSRGNLTAKDAVWQTVPGTRFKFYVYSAHYDDRKSRLIRVIGASKTRATEKVWCRFWYTANVSKVVAAKTKVIRENWNMKYSAIFIFCPLEFNVTLPQSLSIVHKLKLPIRNLLIVRDNKGQMESEDYQGQSYREPPPERMVVCVKPLHFTYDKVLQLLEFLELNKLLGADHVNFYINSVSPAVQCILNQYKNTSHDVNEKDSSHDDVSQLKTGSQSNAQAHNQWKGSLHGTQSQFKEDLQSNTHNQWKNGLYNAQSQSKEDLQSNTHNQWKSGLHGTQSKEDSHDAYSQPNTGSKARSHPFVSTYEWHLNMISQKEIRTEGLFSALNDCLYRNMYLYSYIMFIDLDEFIVPKNNTTLVELISWLSKHLSTHSIGSYSFQNAFFYLQWPNDDSIDLGNRFESSLVSISKTKRKLKLHPHKQRSKYIIRPEHVVEVGNHFVWEFIPGHGSLNVPQNTVILHHYRICQVFFIHLQHKTSSFFSLSGILHHYRICEFGGNDCIKQKHVEDRTAHRYKTQLVANVEAVYDRLKQRCELDVF